MKDIQFCFLQFLLFSQPKFFELENEFLLKKNKTLRFLPLTPRLQNPPFFFFKRRVTFQREKEKRFNKTKQMAKQSRVKKKFQKKKKRKIHFGDILNKNKLKERERINFCFFFIYFWQVCGCGYEFWRLPVRAFLLFLP